jgi:hypothetical protein
MKKYDNYREFALSGQKYLMFAEKSDEISTTSFRFLNNAIYVWISHREKIGDEYKEIIVPILELI